MQGCRAVGVGEVADETAAVGLRLPKVTLVL